VLPTEPADTALFSPYARLLEMASAQIQGSPQRVPLTTMLTTA